MTKVGERIRNKRLERNLSQEAIADALNISQSSYAKLENGQSKIKVERLLQIAEYLKVDPGDLLPEGNLVQINSGTIENQTNYSYIDKLVQANERMSEEKDRLREEQITLLKEQNAFLREELKKRG